MGKIKTVIPVNAKPGKSVIQVVNPRTGKPVRTRVPPEAVPGQAIEIEIPDEIPERGGQSTEERESTDGQQSPTTNYNEDQVVTGM